MFEGIISTHASAGDFPETQLCSCSGPQEPSRAGAKGIGEGKFDLSARYVARLRLASPRSAFLVQHIRGPVFDLHNCPGLAPQRRQSILSGSRVSMMPTFLMSYFDTSKRHSCQALPIARPFLYWAETMSSILLSSSLTLTAPPAMGTGVIPKSVCSSWT